LTPRTDRAAACQQCADEVTISSEAALDRWPGPFSRQLSPDIV